MSAALMTGLMSSLSTQALAQNSFDDYTQDISGVTASPFTNTLAFLCYLGGFVLAALGVVGLKQHVENPGNAPMKNGLAKLGFGGMLMALPPIVSAIQGTGLESGAEQTNLKEFTTTAIGD